MREGHHYVCITHAQTPFVACVRVCDTHYIVVFAIMSIFG